MKRYRSRNRSYRFSVRDSFLTLLLFFLLTVAIVWLDRLSTQDFVGSMKVLDGDSVELNGRRLRLLGIDAPEYVQTCTKAGRTWPCGRESRVALRRLVGDKTVRCTSSGLDRYDRWLATCYVGDVNLNLRLVELGWAIAYGDYTQAERKARKARVGIWSGEFERPQDWRRSRQLTSKSDNGLLNDITNWLRAVMSRVKLANNAEKGE